MSSDWDIDEPRQNLTRGFGRGIPGSTNTQVSPRGRGRGIMSGISADKGSGYSQPQTDMDFENSIETLQVESREVGRIIGKGGSKIRQLQDDSGARINVSRDNSGPKVDVDISGTHEQVAYAKELIEQLIRSGDRGFGGGGFSSGGFGGEETVINVESRDVGKIIGRGGSRIRELREESGASIEVPRDRGPTVAVTLKGSIEAVKKAKQLIEDIINPENFGQLADKPTRRQTDWPTQ